ncbi:ABC alpha-glucoside transporter inner membrane protein AglF [Ketogulonicigenium robustum]|uniref:ABC alpha-glucoside transporter inner membrane protein AglF n=1 Tax=Ketogulonicigenium robustum TaxID=92947 RepID=A0A1W6NZF2_9RHOB|nr:sugar ABC transporter permease [Ketogulonicigenium robustum]ARO14584.1 ABC alpha-glucoside transporter inner membrane protein AglF [Ketogulonicigenium robustum]
MNPALYALIVILLGIGGCIGYFWTANFLLDKVLFPARGANIGRNINRANMVRPWVFLFPALFFLGIYLAYPVFATLSLSLNDRNGAFIGLGNYSRMIAEPKFGESLRNNMLWLVVVPAASTVFGLLAAQLTDRIRWGNLAKSLIFMPMAISFVGASVIWKLVYDARDASLPQVGLLNAVWMQFGGGFWSLLLLRILPAAILVALIVAGALAAWAMVRATPGGKLSANVLRGIGVVIIAALAYVLGGWGLGLLTAALPYGRPQLWLQTPFWNNFFLMMVLVWIQTGFAMVILSAALRGVPEDTIEAAVLDGANPFQIFFRIKVPQIRGTIVVVWTTITIVVLKVFDIVLAMTNGQWETQVLANYMYDKFFRSFDTGMGSAAAMVIMALVTPILIWNVWNARKEMR